MTGEEPAADDPTSATVATAGATFHEPPALLAADFCSGIRAPISFALAWCGWQVETFDIELGFDLSGREHDQLWKRRDEFLVRMWACRAALSRERERSDWLAARTAVRHG